MRQPIGAARFHQGGTQRQGCDNNEYDLRAQRVDGIAPLETPGGDQRQGAKQCTGCDRQNAQRRQCNHHYHDQEGQRRFAGAGEIRRAVQHQQFTARLEERYVAGTALHQQHVTGFKLAFVQAGRFKWEHAAGAVQGKNREAIFFLQPYVSQFHAVQAGAQCDHYFRQLLVFGRQYVFRTGI